METIQSANIISLPDGTSLDLKTNNIKAPEGIFQPRVIGNTNIGIQNLILNSLKKVDHDFKGDIFQNIILTGGNTLFSNFNE